MRALEQRVRVRAAAGLHRRDLHRRVEVGDVEDAHAPEAERIPRRDARCAAVRARPRLLGGHEEQVPVDGDLALPTRTHDSRPERRVVRIGDVVDQETVEVADEGVVALERQVGVDEPEVARVRRVEPAGWLGPIGGVRKPERRDPRRGILEEAGGKARARVVRVVRRSARCRRQPGEDEQRRADGDRAAEPPMPPSRESFEHHPPPVSPSDCRYRRAYTRPLPMGNGALRHINRGAAFVAAAIAGLGLAACSGGGAEQVEGQTTGEVAPNIVQPGAPGQPSQHALGRGSRQPAEGAVHRRRRQLHAGDDPPPRPGAPHDGARPPAHRQRGHPAPRAPDRRVTGDRDRADAALADHAGRAGADPPPRTRARARHRPGADAGDAERHAAAEARGGARRRLRPPVPPRHDPAPPRRAGHGPAPLRRQRRGGVGGRRVRAARRRRPDDRDRADAGHARRAR